MASTPTAPTPKALCVCRAYLVQHNKWHNESQFNGIAPRAHLSCIIIPGDYNHGTRTTNRINCVRSTGNVRVSVQLLSSRPYTECLEQRGCGRGRCNRCTKRWRVSATIRVNSAGGCGDITIRGIPTSARHWIIICKSERRIMPINGIDIITIITSNHQHNCQSHHPYSLSFPVTSDEEEAAAAVNE